METVTWREHDEHRAPEPAELDISSSGENSRPIREVRECCDGALFASHRARLFGIAYRMLRSRADAEDLVQDVYLRWHQSARRDIESPIAFLVTITTRLCLDRLRHLKQEREHCVEARLPELIAEDQIPSPDTQLERADEVAAAFLAVLERLGPEERAAFLLHDVFDRDYSQVAQVLGKAEPTCRQIIHRARTRLREPRQRFLVTPESRERVLRKFLAAVRSGDRNAVAALLAEEVEYVADASAHFAVRVERSPKLSAPMQENTMKSGKSVPRVSVETFALTKQRPINNLKRVPLVGSIVCGEDSRLRVDQAQLPGDPAARVGYVCPGRAQDHSDQGTGGVYEMDNETYQTTKVG